MISDKNYPKRTYKTVLYAFVHWNCYVDPKRLAILQKRSVDAPIHQFVITKMISFDDYYKFFK